jgi:predicted TIM-barrel fold metal-dependent hydrolase
VILAMAAQGPALRTIHGAWREDEDAVTLVDAHHHIWDLKRNHYPWLADHPEPHFFLGNYDALKRDYLPDDYRRDAQQHNVLMTVHCEAEWDRNDQVGETRWLTEINARYGFPNAIVAHAWFHTPNAEEVLAAQAAFPLVRGIRSKPVTSLSPATINPGAPGTMQDEAWLRGFSLLERHGFSWDLRVPFWHLPEAAEVARQFPNRPIVLNHTGFPWDRSQEGLAAWRAAMETIAREPNVWLKVSEFGLRDQPWDYESNRRIVLDAISIFGIGRCLFATNFPVAGLRIDYDTLVRSVRRMLDPFTPQERERFFVRNAIAFYRLPEPQPA